MRKKKNNTKYFILGGIVLFAVLLAITSNNISDSKDLNFFEKAIKDTGVYTQKIFYAPIKFVKDKLEVFNEKKDLYKKYTKLKEKVEKTDLYYAEIKDLQKEVTELKSVLGLNATLSEYTYVNATVVNRNVGYWYNNLTIDKGSKNGVKKGDAVIISNGLIGKVTSVSNFSSNVKLLSSDKISNKISVKIESDNDFLYGLLIGYDIENNIYKIEGITDSSKVKEGALVTTTGLTDYFPSGLLIGRVSKIVKDEYDLNSIVEVTPSVDFKNISIVTVLNRKAIE
ncbi:MAG: rod shape-determining protein MreC [bacterium]|nr:rod shape-determining protein MreC [bacterium]